MHKKWIISILCVSIFALLISCEKENDEPGENHKMESSFNDKESHNTGQNCFNCHKTGGNAEGLFTVSGTVYNSTKTETYPNAIVKLYTGPDETGTLTKTIEVDGKGNFYTTADMNFSSGLYVTVAGTSGNVAKMNSSVSTGQCNSCHGSNTERISAD